MDKQPNTFAIPLFDYVYRRYYSCKSYLDQWTLYEPLQLGIVHRKSARMERVPYIVGTTSPPFLTPLHTNVSIPS